MRKLIPNTDGIVIHLDYDCFYASCVENQHPELKGRPLAVQQKQIIVTCNYPARERGLRKLQLITEAKHICPELIIVLGEDISLFRDVSKELLQFVRSFSWNSKVQRLGLDEVFLDVTDIIDHNLDLLNTHSLASSFFQLSKTNPLLGFEFDATVVAGEVYNGQSSIYSKKDARLWQRLALASHLCMHIRQQLETVKGYTCTGGIATNKLLSKLVGNVHKPRNQTTLMPPYVSHDLQENAVIDFIDSHEVGKIPGIGFKMALRLREHAHRRKVEVKDLIMIVHDSDLIKVGDLKALSPGLDEAVLERILSGPGAPKGIGTFVWKALHGVDDQEVAAAREVPKQISIEDSYLRLDTLDSVIQQMTQLTTRLITRMRLDLTAPADDNDDNSAAAEDSAKIPSAEPATAPAIAWLAQPRTIRLSTRPRAPIGPDGTRPRSFARISRSRPLPACMLSLHEPAAAIAARAVAECLLPMLRQLHPPRSVSARGEAHAGSGTGWGWDLSLVNVAVTEMQEMGGERKAALGRDIGKMFRNQDAVLSAFRVQEPAEDVTASKGQTTLNDLFVVDDVEQNAMAGGSGDIHHETSMTPALAIAGSEDTGPLSQLSQQTRVSESAEWDVLDVEEHDDHSDYRCPLCAARMPAFAIAAHERYHDQELPD